MSIVSGGENRPGGSDAETDPVTDAHSVGTQTLIGKGVPTILTAP